MSLKSSFVSYLNQKYPDLKAEQIDPLISEQLLSPFQISLTYAQVEQIKSEIEAYWQLRAWGEANLQADFEKHGLRRPSNYAACMSYDFHINSAGKTELIEINTNASFLALGLELLSFLKLPNVAGEFNDTDLAAMFKNEISAAAGRTEASVAIIDEQPEQQRLYLEFLVYQSLLRRHGLKTDILDITAADQFENYSLIYNRYTDFYLQEEKSKRIRSLYNEKKIELSPQPYDYFLLADKQRLIDWNRQKDVPLPTSLLKIYDLAHEEKDFIWQERKHLFFKPKNSFGGKQAYKGASLSRKVFDEVFNENFVAQQFSAPSTVEVQMNNEAVSFKYDLRCFAYQNKLQLIVARLYQGQTTNLKTPGGGFAAVRIVN